MPALGPVNVPRYWDAFLPNATVPVALVCRSLYRFFPLWSKLSRTGTTLEQLYRRCAAAQLRGHVLGLVLEHFTKDPRVCRRWTRGWRVLQAECLAGYLRAGELGAGVAAYVRPRLAFILKRTPRSRVALFREDLDTLGRLTASLIGRARRQVGGDFGGASAFSDVWVGARRWLFRVCHKREYRFARSREKPIMVAEFAGVIRRSLSGRPAGEPESFAPTAARGKN